MITNSCRVEQQPARQAHNLKVVGANPTPASILITQLYRWNVCDEFRPSSQRDGA